MKNHRSNQLVHISTSYFHDIVRTYSTRGTVGLTSHLTNTEPKKKSSENVLENLVTPNKEAMKLINARLMVPSFVRTRKLSSSSSSNSSSSYLSKAVAWYANKLETNPLATKCTTSGFIAGSGDVICQYIVHYYRLHDHDDSHKSSDIILTASSSSEKVHDDILHSFVPDWTRTLRFSLLGFGLVAPVVHHWYGLLMTKLPGKDAKAALQRLFCDQILFAPVFIPTFMTSLMVLEGKDMDIITSTLNSNVSDVVVSNWTLWVPAMFVNFRFVPMNWQVLYSNCIGLIWNIYLSWKTQVDSKLK